MTKFKNAQKLIAMLLPICVLVCSLSCCFALFVPASQGVVEYAEAVTSLDAPYYTGNYYDDLNENLTGTAFRTELADLSTETHRKETTYAGLMDVWKYSDVDPNNSNKIIEFYTGYSVTIPSNYNSGTNREHVWPKNAGNAFPETSKAGSDAHHLRPANTNLNSSRGSKSFGEVATTSANLVSQSSGSNPCYATSSLFYPGEGFRGATARILMYVQTRWGDDYNLSFVLGAGSNKTIGDIEDLMKWHIEEPPTDLEITRNNEIAKIQGNRNPFIDHPEYAEMIYCNDGKSYNDELQNVVKTYGSYLDGSAGNEGGGSGSTVTKPTSLVLSQTSLSLVAGGTQTLTVTASPSGASNSVTWTSSNSSVASVSGGVVTAVSAGTATITATSTVDNTVKATATVSVKAVSSISVSGTPTKTTYTAGETFNPVGLTVTATYTNGETIVISNDDCEWLDGSARTEALAQGSTSVICKYGNSEKIISGITVKQATMKMLTITRSDFVGSGAYAWATWSDSGISGQAYMYPGNSTSIQMNSSKSCKYIFNSTALSGGIVSISIKNTSQTTSDKTWKILTSSTAFTAVESGEPSGGTNRGTLTSTLEGGKLDINTTDQYFAIVYTSTGAVYLDEITIVYGAQEDACDHVVGDWIIDSQATCNQKGSKHTECEECGEVVDVAEIPLTGHNFSAWSETTAPTCEEVGEESRTCGTCGETETREVEELGHSFGAWTEITAPTCSSEGEESSVCGTCGESETRAIEKLEHTFGDWSETTAPTCEEVGEESRTCGTCGETETREVEELGHSFGAWTEITAPTCSSEGEESSVCGTCGESETRAIEKLEHTFGEWTDADEDTEERVCSACGETEERSKPNLIAVQNFKDLVEAVQEANGVTEKWNAIGEALDAYDELTESEKELVSAEYVILGQEIIAYNAEATKINTEADRAVGFAFLFFASATSILAIAIRLFLNAKA